MKLSDLVLRLRLDGVARVRFAFAWYNDQTDTRAEQYLDAEGHLVEPNFDQINPGSHTPNYGDTYDSFAVMDTLHDLTGDGVWELNVTTGQIHRAGEIRFIDEYDDEDGYNRVPEAEFGEVDPTPYQRVRSYY